jgi:alkylated DNA repair protein alkB homolog 6
LQKIEFQERIKLIMIELSNYRVTSAPDTVYYIPNFITTEEETYLLNNVYNAPKPKWTQLSNRRLQNWGGLPKAKGMILEDIPAWLNIYCEKVAKFGQFDNKIPNHVLVNEYLSGQGIMPHEDGPSYYPCVTTLSLGSHTLLDFYKPVNEEALELTFESRYLFSLMLEPRSLVILKDDMYQKYLHGIKEVTQDEINFDLLRNFECLGNKSQYKHFDTIKRDTRVSLTIRFVPKTIKLNPNLLLKKK